MYSIPIVLPKIFERAHKHRSKLRPSKPIVASLTVFALAMPFAGPTAANAQDHSSPTQSSSELAKSLGGPEAKTVVAQSRRKESRDDDEAEDEDEEGGEDEKAEGEESGEDEKETAEASQGSTLRRGGRMEFDARLIRGQTAGSGAVFLFQRVPRPLPSMVERRTSYLGESVERTLGESGRSEFAEAKNDVIEGKKEVKRKKRRRKSRRNRR